MRWLTPIVFCLLMQLSRNAASQERSALCMPISMPPPVYPEKLSKKSIGGEVVIVVQVDGCGTVRNARIERSSLNDELDAAGLAAVISWTLSPEKFDVSMSTPGALSSIRVPVSFEGRRQVPRRTYDKCWLIRSTRRISTPLGEDGEPIKGFIEDPCPVGFATVGKSLNYVRETSNYTRTMPNGIYAYRVHDQDGISWWYFMAPLDAAYPAVFRHRVVNDGKYFFSVTSLLCESSKRACDDLMASLKEHTRQKMELVPPMPKNL